MFKAGQIVTPKLDSNYLLVTPGKEYEIMDIDSTWGIYLYDNRGFKTWYKENTFELLPTPAPDYMELFL